MTAAEYKQLIQMLKAMEISINNRIDMMTRKILDALKGFGFLDPDKDTLTSKEVCAQYNISKRSLCTYREKGLIPYIKEGKGKNAKVKYRIVDVIEFFALRES